MGNFQSLVKAQKNSGDEKRKFYLVGGGIASLAAAGFLIRDGHIPGENITILEALSLPGGSLDGIKDPDKGYIIRGGREMEEFFECTWDLFSSIDSLEEEGKSVLEEFRELNEADPSSSPIRVIEKQGQNAHTDGKLGLNKKSIKELTKLIMAKEEDLSDQTIAEYFSKDFLDSNMWLYWRTMFAFEEWHSLVEMKRYMERFIHHLPKIGDLSSLKFTKYNQYESLVLPLMEYLKKNDVVFKYDTTVTDVDFNFQDEIKIATAIHCTSGGKDDVIELGEKDIIFITNGSMTENSSCGDMDKAPAFDCTIRGSWKLWKNISAKDESFGHPEVFCEHADKSYWESFTITNKGPKVPDLIKKITGRDPKNGKIVTGGPLTIRDSSWLLTFTVSRQPHFKGQPDNVMIIWAYGLFGDKKGDHIKKAMKDCTGEELVMELFYHLGVPEAELADYVATTRVIPVMMPFITAQFMPRKAGDRPAVVPKGSKNFAFIGQFTELPRDTVFTVEYSVRAAMTAVYTLLNIDRKVPEVYPSLYDLRVLGSAIRAMNDGDEHIGIITFILKKKLKSTQFKDLI